MADIIHQISTSRIRKHPDGTPYPLPHTLPTPSYPLPILQQGPISALLLLQCNPSPPQPLPSNATVLSTTPFLHKKTFRAPNPVFPPFPSPIRQTPLLYIRY